MWVVRTNRRKGSEFIGKDLKKKFHSAARAVSMLLYLAVHIKEGINQGGTTVYSYVAVL